VGNFSLPRGPWSFWDFQIGPPDPLPLFFFLAHVFLCTIPLPPLLCFPRLPVQLPRPPLCKPSSPTSCFPSLHASSFPYPGLVSPPCYLVVSAPRPPEPPPAATSPPPCSARMPALFPSLSCSAEPVDATRSISISFSLPCAPWARAPPPPSLHPFRWSTGRRGQPLPGTHCPHWPPNEFPWPPLVLTDRPPIPAGTPLPTSAAHRRLLLAVGHPSPAFLNPNWPRTELPHTAGKLPDHFLTAHDHRSTAPPFPSAASRLLLSHRHYRLPPPDREQSQVRKDLMVLPYPSILAASDRRHQDWPVKP
jgi:hypothetical protein